MNTSRIYNLCKINIASFLSASIGGIALIWTAFVLKEPSRIPTDNNVKNDNGDINMDSLDGINDKCNINNKMISEIPTQNMLNESLILNSSVEKINTTVNNKQ